MSTVWVVEEGEYSDRRIVAVCSTWDKAQKVIAMLGGTAREIAVDVLDSFAGLQWYGVRIDERGRVDRDWLFDYADLSEQPKRRRAWMTFTWKDDADLPPEKRGGSAPGGGRLVTLGSIEDDAWKVLRVWVWAESLEHARASAQDLRRQLMASGEWERIKVGLEVAA